MSAALDYFVKCRDCGAILSPKQFEALHVLRDDVDPVVGDVMVRQCSCSAELAVPIVRYPRPRYLRFNERR